MNQKISSSGFISQFMNKLVTVDIQGGAAAANDSEHGEPANDIQSCSEVQTEKSLRKLSNAELHDLGISLGEIAYVVSHGRPDIDPDPDPAGRCAA